MANQTIPERWLPVEGAPGYDVSDLGRVRSLDRIAFDKNGQAKQFKGRILRPGPHGPRADYVAVSLGRDLHVAVHILVCTAFHGPRPSPEHEVAHEDGNGRNNVPSNLRWATKRENEDDKVQHGTRTRGSRHGPAKLHENQVLEIRRLLAAGMQAKAVAKQTGATIHSVYSIKNGHSWTWL